MSALREKIGAVVRNRTAVLMARIVDVAGAVIRASQVEAIEYSIFEIDRRVSTQPSSVAAHQQIPLDVRVVMFETLRFGGDWTLDVCGYNFRHEIAFAQGDGHFEAGNGYEIRYLFTPMFGPRSIFRFHLRCFKR